MKILRLAHQYCGGGGYERICAEMGRFILCVGENFGMIGALGGCLPVDDVNNIFRRRGQGRYSIFNKR
jgi:hypothetical protein